MLHFQPRPAAPTRIQRLKGLARAGLAWVGLWAALLAGSAMAAFMTDAASSKSTQQQPEERADAAAPR